MDVSVINPHIRVYMRSVLPKGHEIARRVIFDYELIFIEEGGMTLEYDGIDYRCTKGQFLLLRPSISHRFHGIDEDLSQPHVHFDITHTADSAEVPVSFKDIDQLSERERGQLRQDIFAHYPKTPYVTFTDTEAALRLFFAIVGQPTLSPLRRKGLLTELIDLLITDNFPELFTKNEAHYGVEQQVKDYIDAGQGRGATLEEIACLFGYSKYHLERRFKERFGTGVIAYRNERRLLAARERLKEKSVSAVAQELGFSSIYVFSRAFKNRFGISPTSSKK